MPKKDVDHALPMPDDATHTPLNVWGLPDKMQGVPKSMTLYMRVRKWLPLAMSFPLREGWTGYFIRVLFPIVIGLCVALRITSLIINVMNVDVQLFEEDTKQWEHRVVSFAFKTLLVDFWESKAEILAVFIFISSALVPISSILMMLVMWLFPFNPKWRGRIFKFSDIQSKFTFVSEVFLVLVCVMLLLHSFFLPYIFVTNPFIYTRTHTYIYKQTGTRNICKYRCDDRNNTCSNASSSW